MIKLEKWKRIGAILLLIIIAVLICFLINLKTRKMIQEKVDYWADRNNISVEKVAFSKSELSHIEKSFYEKKYSITLFCSGFEGLSPQQMGTVARDWYEDVHIKDKDIICSLDYIVSNGNRYKLDTDTGAVELNGKTIAAGQSSKYNYNNFNNSSGKTAICNYCNGTGKVNGEKCPWCNGSGKTYDNYFNDVLGD